MSQYTFPINTDVQQLINLIINTFSSDKEVFLRELVFNASDALDKIRYKSITGHPIYREPNFRIRIIPDKNNTTLTVIDTGIGMTRDELINKLVTMEKPGTKAFMKALQSNTNVSTIDQFGIGFYAVFLVADKVTVISKSDDEEKQWKWETSLDGNFTVSEDGENEEKLTRGTKVVLHLKKENLEFLEEKKLREIIQSRCQFVGFPIELQAEKTEEGRSEGEEIIKKDLRVIERGETPKDVDKDITMEEEKIHEKQRGHKEAIYEWKKINKTMSIWLKKPKDVTKEEYAAFYKTLTHDSEDPLAVSHFSIEGQLEFTSILFIPRRAPWDLYEPRKKRKNIRLYVRREFIMEDCEELLPEYLGFVKGIVDSEDLPLNISQEFLHTNKIFKLIRENVVRKVFELIQEISMIKEDYNIFYRQFSKNIKLGIVEDTVYRLRLAEFLRFYTSKSGNEQVSLKEYVARMKEDQKDIYFIISESLNAASSSSVDNSIKEKGYEVIYMVDPIDVSIIQQLKEFDGKSFKNCGKERMEVETREHTRILKEQGEGSYKRDVESISGNQAEMGDTFGSKMEEVPRG